jgi:hypothetical protein
MTERFEILPDGAVRVTLSREEAELLRSLPNELRSLYEAGPSDDDPVSARLFPRAYLDPTAEDAEREWRELVHPELIRERVAALELLAGTLDQAGSGRTVVADLQPDAVQAWLGVLNDSRLALGTRLGVTEHLDYEDVQPDDPLAPAFAAYGWLTYLEGELVEALLGGTDFDPE